MTRFIFVIGFIFLQEFKGYTQDVQNILRCESKSTLLKVPLTNGKLSEWRPFGDFDETTQTNITFDFTKLKIYWDTKSKNNNKNFDRGIRVYEINNIVKDTTYADFGFSCLKITCTDEDKKILQYELIGFDLEDCFHLYLIENSKNLKVKRELLVK